MLLFAVLSVACWNAAVGRYFYFVILFDLVYIDAFFGVFGRMMNLISLAKLMWLLNPCRAGMEQEE